MSSNIKTPSIYQNHERYSKSFSIIAESHTHHSDLSRHTDNDYLMCLPFYMKKVVMLGTHYPTIGVFKIADRETSSNIFHRFISNHERHFKAILRISLCKSCCVVILIQ